MLQELLSRLETTIACLLEKNRQLEEECRVLKQEQCDWQLERSELLTTVDKILAVIEKVEEEQ